MTEKGRITYVKFETEVTVGGDFHGLQSWTFDKHGEKGITLAEEGPWLVMTVQDGTTRWIPIHNVAFIARAKPEGTKK